MQKLKLRLYVIDIKRYFPVAEIDFTSGEVTYDHDGWCTVFYLDENCTLEIWINNSWEKIEELRYFG